MRCKDVKEILEMASEDIFPASVREHLAVCPDCRETRMNLGLLRAAFRALTQDPPPESSFGFSTRVLRRLQSAGDSGGAAAEFIERIGRRFVLAGLLVIMSLLLAFTLPSSGPLRGPSPDEPYLAQSEPAAPGEVNYLADEFGESHDATPVNSTQGSGQPHK